MNVRGDGTTAPLRCLGFQRGIMFVISMSDFRVACVSRNTLLSLKYTKCVCVAGVQTAWASVGKKAAR